MKKQYFLSTLLITLLLIFNVTSSFADDPDFLSGAPQKLPPTTLNCSNTEGHLNPIPGVNYNYEITTEASTVDAVHWFVTDDPNVISLVSGTPTLTANRDIEGASAEYILDADDAVYNIPANTAKAIDISWQYFDGTANQVLLVAYVKGAAGCSDNVEVWRIEPTILFTLDVISMTDAGVIDQLGDPAEKCVSPVQEATYDGTNLTMNYGSNYVYFTVTAANFTHSWMSDITADITTGAAITSIEWAYPSEAQTTGAWRPLTEAIEAQDATGVVGDQGEAIVVRVLIEHGSIQEPLGLTEATVTLFVDGIMYDSANANYANLDLADVDSGAAPTDPCVNNVTDEAEYVLLPRPDIIEENPAAPSFEPKN